MITREMTTHLLVLILKICQSVWDVVGIANVVNGHLGVASNALKDAVDEAQHGGSFVFPVVF